MQACSAARSSTRSSSWCIFIFFMVLSMIFFCSACKLQGDRDLCPSVVIVLDCGDPVRGTKCGLVWPAGQRNRWILMHVAASTENLAGVTNCKGGAVFDEIARRATMQVVKDGWNGFLSMWCVRSTVAPR